MIKKKFNAVSWTIKMKMIKYFRAAYKRPMHIRGSLEQNIQDGQYNWLSLFVPSFNIFKNSVPS